MSALITMGIGAACIIMGAFMVVGAIVFAFIAKKGGFAKIDDNNNNRKNNYVS